MEHFYTQGSPEHPIREVLKHIMHKAPPKFVRGYDYSNLTDDQHTELQDWVGMNIPKAIYWSTAIGIIEAAATLVEEAVSNANIPPPPVKKRVRMKKKAVRGFTVVELMIVMAMLGVLAVGVIFIFQALTSSSVFDKSDAARRWATTLGFTLMGVTCSDVVEGMFVRCTVRVKEREELYAVECHTINGNCALVRQGQRL